MPQKHRKTAGKQAAKKAVAAKTAWGGRRKGAGRPEANAEGPVIAVGLTIPRRLIDELDKAAEKRGVNRSQAATVAIRRLLRSQWAQA